MSMTDKVNFKCFKLLQFILQAEEKPIHRTDHHS